MVQLYWTGPGKHNSSKASDAEDKAEQRLQTQLLATLVHEFRGWMKAQGTESKVGLIVSATLASWLVLMPT